MPRYLSNSSIASAVAETPGISTNALAISEIYISENPLEFPEMPDIQKSL